MKKRKLSKQREQFCEQNGGTILKQKVQAKLTGADSVKVFTVEVLERATDNYSDNSIIGRGRYDTVYKGILPEKHVVAIKKYSKVSLGGGLKEHFINEVIVLAQINHPNVVKLLGCCLEDEVPILVYEFISNNTLSHHIQSKPGGRDWLSWDNRLRIASESAGALAYLHDSVVPSMPVVHRDVKSSKILLDDDNYTTKVSFGSSRLVPLDHSDQVVQRTLGYLDPEYFHTGQLTEKSDVYSFGVVIAELLTGQKPICGDGSTDQDESWNLAAYFVVSMEQNCLFEILEPRLLREVIWDQLQAAAELARRCLRGKGEDRPTMKEVAMRLECLRKFSTRHDHQWDGHEHAGHEDKIRSLMVESDESDLYTAPQSPYNNTFGGQCSSNSAFIMLQVNSPH